MDARMTSNDFVERSEMSLLLWTGYQVIKFDNSKTFLRLFSPLKSSKLPNFYVRFIFTFNKKSHKVPNFPLIY